MQCPYCDENSILSEDAMDRHIVKNHPELTDVGEIRDRKMSLIQTWAMGLTTSVYGQTGGNKKEDVLETYKYFIRELMKYNI